MARRLEPVRGRRPAGDARFGPRHHDDPRLSHARPSACQSRSARHRQAAEDHEELSSRGLWLHRGRLRPQDLHRQRARARIRHHPRDAGDPEAHLLLDARRRVHAHLRSESRRPGSRSASKARQGDRVHAAKARRRSCQQADRGRGLREVHRRQVHRHQALRPRWRRGADPGARADHQARRRARVQEIVSAWPIAAASTC
jgi:hypothetical protein